VPVCQGQGGTVGFNKCPGSYIPYPPRWVVDNSTLKNAAKNFGTPEVDAYNLGYTKGTVLSAGSYMPLTFNNTRKTDIYIALINSTTGNPMNEDGFANYIIFGSQGFDQIFGVSGSKYHPKLMAVTGSSTKKIDVVNNSTEYFSEITNCHVNSCIDDYNISFNTVESARGFVAVFNLNGTLQWGVTVCDSRNIRLEFYDSFISPDGLVIAVGSTHGKIEMNEIYNNITIYDEDEYSSGDAGIMFKFDVDGTPLWLRYLVSSKPEANRFIESSDKITNVVNEVGGTIFVCGFTNGNIFPNNVAKTESGEKYSNTNYESDFFVARYDGEGKLVWGFQYGSYASDKAFSIDHLQNDEFDVLIVGGTTNGDLFVEQTFGDFDIFVVKINPDTGELIKGIQIGSDKEDHLRTVAIGENGHVFVSGWAGGSISGSKFSGGYSDAVVLTFDKALSDVPISIFMFGTPGNDKLTGMLTSERFTDVVYIQGTGDCEFDPASADHYLVSYDIHITCAREGGEYFNNDICTKCPAGTYSTDGYQENSCLECSGLHFSGEGSNICDRFYFDLPVLNYLGFSLALTILYGSILFFIGPEDKSRGFDAFILTILPFANVLSDLLYVTNTVFSSETTFFGSIFFIIFPSISFIGWLRRKKIKPRFLVPYPIFKYTGEDFFFLRVGGSDHKEARNLPHYKGECVVPLSIREAAELETMDSIIKYVILGLLWIIPIILITLNFLFYAIFFCLHFHLVLLFLMGLFLYVTQLLVIRNVQNFWLVFYAQNPGKALASREWEWDGKLFNENKLSEMFLNYLPILIIQAYNNTLLDYWGPVAIISMTVSFLSLIDVLFTFFYYLVGGDRTVRTAIIWFSFFGLYAFRIMSEKEILRGVEEDISRQARILELAELAANNLRLTSSSSTTEEDVPNPIFSGYGVGGPVSGKSNQFSSVTNA
jgi:hypothetical protein